MYKVKLTVLDENNNPKGSALISDELIESVKKIHGVSALDEHLKSLLKEIRNG